MMVQYAKFGKIANEASWRRPIGSINYLETSTWTRQEHNGFSHQNPSFIGAVLNLKPDAARVYFPPDANTFLSTMAHCLQSKNYVNLMVGSKQPSAVFLSADEAENHCRAGASVWRFASTEDGMDPDAVLVGIGAELTLEVIAAAELLRQKTPELRVRVVNVTDLMILGASSSHPHTLTDEAFDALFTSDVPIHFNYHGYANELKACSSGARTCTASPSPATTRRAPPPPPSTRCYSMGPAASTSPSRPSRALPAGMTVSGCICTNSSVALTG